MRTQRHRCWAGAARRGCPRTTWRRRGQRRGALGRGLPGPCGRPVLSSGPAQPVSGAIRSPLALQSVIRAPSHGDGVRQGGTSCPGSWSPGLETGSGEGLERRGGIAGAQGDSRYLREAPHLVPGGGQAPLMRAGAPDADAREPRPSMDVVAPHALPRQFGRRGVGDIGGPVHGDIRGPASGSRRMARATPTPRIAAARAARLVGDSCISTTSTSAATSRPPTQI